MKTSSTDKPDRSRAGLPGRFVRRVWKRTDMGSRGGFTLVEIMIVIAIIALIGAIALPNFIKSRRDSQATMCTMWLERIAGAKVQVAFAENMPANSTPADTLLLAYIGDSSLTALNGVTTICPAGGAYAVNNLETNPSCTLAQSPGYHRVE